MNKSIDKTSLIYGILAFLICFSLVPLLGNTVPNQQRGAKPTSTKLPGSRAEVYKTIDDVNLLIHIFEPKGLKPGQKRPAIVFFFGGGWRQGDPKQFAPHCQYLASRGMVAMTADYRVFNRHGTKAVTCVKDAKSAIRWIRRNSERLGIDPEKLGAGGGSAGGHLAAATGTLSKFDEPGEDLSISSVPDFMVLFNPATVLAPVEKVLPFDKSRMAELTARFGVKAEEISPYHNVDTGVAPTIIHHGTADKTVPFETAALFNEEMKRKGNRCELKSYEGAGHGFFNWGRSENKHFIETMQKTDKFLRSLGLLSGAETVKEFTLSSSS